MAMGRSDKFTARFFFPPACHNRHRRRDLEKLAVDQMVFVFLASCGTRMFIDGQGEKNAPFYRN